MTFFEPDTSRCPKNGVHCWHQEPVSPTAGAPLMPSSICCHCGKRVNYAMVTTLMHGPHEPSLTR